MEKEMIFESSSNGSTELNRNVLEFQYSFGYNTQKYFNMCVADECTIVFGSGNLIHIYNVEKEEFRFHRTWTGGGIAHITKNPLFEHIAVANNGYEPVVVIYNWPAMDIISLLKGGTTKMYSFMSYSTDGEMLCVQGGGPDFFLTLWDWKNAVILRQQRSHINNVYNIAFSPYTKQLMCTGGWKHINFWNIAKTFSGLKLIQNPGRFGKRDASHVIGILPLPDGQVISGCEWGNMLLWSDGVIKMELCGLNGQPCHEAPISQILLEGKELLSIGRDGMINTWYFEEIENADPQDDNFKLEMRPYRSIRIGSETSKSSLVAIAKQYQHDSEDTNWFAQDANGRLWKVNLSQASDLPAEEVFIVHVGAVVAIAASPHHPLLASLDQSGRLLVHDYSKKKLISHAEFSSRGSSIIWLPSSVDESGSTLVAGFEDGTLHIFKLLLQETKLDTSCTELVDVIESQIMKPHSSTITKIITHEPDRLLITGSYDASVFLYFMSMENKEMHAVPIGFCKVPSGVSYIGLKQDEKFVLKAGCITGHYVEIELSPNLELCSDESLLLKYVTTREIHLVLEASKILDLNINKRKETRGIDLNSDECDTQTQINDQVDIGARQICVLSTNVHERSITSPNHYCPDDTAIMYGCEYKCPVLHSIQTQFSEILLISGGRNAGCVWKYTTENVEPEYCLPLLDKTSAGISTCLCSVDGKYLIFGTFDGKLCVRSIENSTVNSSSNWFLSMHDNFKGTVTGLRFSNDHSLLFSCGEDGNIFSYKFNCNEGISAASRQDDKSFFKHVTKSLKWKVNDLLEEDMDISYSLEETLQRKVKEKKLETARKRKEEILRLLEDYQGCFKNILERNDSLPVSQKIPHSYFEIDRRITEDMEIEFQREADLVKKMMEFRVEKSSIALKKMMEFLIASPGSFIVTLFAVKHKWAVSTMCQQKLGTDFHKAKQAVEQKMKEFELREKWEAGLKSTIREHERRMTQDTILVVEEKRINPIDISLRGVNMNSLEYKLNTKFNRLLEKYQSRRNKMDNRMREWEKHRKQKPDATKSDPDDIAAIEEAERTIGDFKLKSSQNFSVPRHSCVTFTRKYNQLLAAREKLFFMKEEFNNKVFDLRKEKVILIQKMKELHACIDILHEELQLENLKHVSSIPEFNMDKEFPEKKFQLQIPEEKAEDSFLSKGTCSLPDVSNPYVPFLDCGKEKEYLQNSTNKVNGDSTRNKLTVHFHPACVMSFSNDTEDTHHWETEFKEINTSRKLFECDRILKEIDKHIFEFDKKIKKLGEMKISVDVEAKFQELHILSLHQEVIVLRDFHTEDEEMNMVLSEHLSQKHSIQLKITELQNDIESRTKDLEILKNMNKNILKSFDEAVSQDKFADILRHIFGKRYHQSNSEEAQDSDDNMSLYEDSSSDDDIGNESLTPAEMRPQGIIDNVCPEGCRVELYELTLKLRSDRYSLEQRIAEKIKEIEEIKKEFETNSKKMKSVEINSKLLQQRYDALQVKKQKMLNRIETVVALQLDQIQCMDSTNTITQRMSDKLLFSANVLQQLVQRVTELQKETDDQKDIQRTNKQHLHRLKIDCNHMENEIGKLKSQIDACMIRKFGQKIDLDKLEEAILQQNISKMKSPAIRIKNTYERKIAEFKMKIQEKEECLSLTRQQNTEKLHVLTILEEQKNKKTVAAQNRKIKHADDYLQKVAEYAADCNKLSLLSKQLNEQADILKREIKLLRMKTRPHQLPALQHEKEMFKPFSPAAKNEKTEYLDKKRDIDEADIQAQNDQETESDKSFTEEEEEEQEERAGKEDHHMGVQNLLENVLKRFTVPKKDKQSPTEQSKEIKDSECMEAAAKTMDNNIRHYVQDLLPAIINEVGQLDISLGLTVIDDIIDKLSYRLELQEDTDNIKVILSQIIIDLSSKDVSNPELAISETIQDIETKEEHDYEDITDVKLILYHIIKDTLTLLAEEDFK